jgi:alpha-L-rhamnosidase
MPNRRDFLRQTVGTGAFLGLAPSSVLPVSPSGELPTAASGPSSVLPAMPPGEQGAPAFATLDLPPAAGRLDLSPASWVWYPSTRTLPNTVVLFRRTFRLTAPVRKATGWIAADSRYLLTVNGRRVSWGPAPSDPRRIEVDPLDISALLLPGDNVLGATVLYYGHGDGTHPIGKPGFILTLSIEYTDGSVVKIGTDQTWSCHLATSWPPGQYKRWYLRALQEEFDARKYPYGWNTPGFVPGSDWPAVMPLDCPASLPPICSRYPDDLMETSAEKSLCCLLPRSIPLLRESFVPVKKLTEAFVISWNRPPAEYFDMVPAGAYTQKVLSGVRESPAGTWQLEAQAVPQAVPQGEAQAEPQTGTVYGQSIALTFELEDQIVGFPEFTIHAPAGTIVELLAHEAHTPGSPTLLNTHFNSWARFICREGENTFRTFDYESLRWLQLHMRGREGTVTISHVGVLRRMYPWPAPPHITCSEPPLQRLMEACVNTLYNSSQETFVDGMGRERQQYSGDGSHQMHAAYLTMGETRLPARFISTFSQGQLKEGYFFDCWPAYDRLARVMERNINMTIWGPLLDHAVGFGFDCFHHYLYTGDFEAVRESFARLQRFIAYLRRIQGPDGLLPVTDLGVPAVWIDHDAYRQQRHKQCAFNLYAAAMSRHAFVPLARAAGNEEWALYATSFAEHILTAVHKTFWDADEHVFVNNLPWRAEEGESRMCDRSLATALLYGLCPRNDTTTIIRTLADCPPAMGISYPANAGWRYWALAEGGRTDVILHEFRERWAVMDSVLLNNTVAEMWNAHPDSGDLWSHCAIVPLYVTFMSIAGIRPTGPGFSQCAIRPQPADLQQLELTLRTVRGDILFRSHGLRGDRELTLEVPSNIQATLLLDPREKVSLTPAHEAPSPECSGYVLPGGGRVTVKLKYT